MTDPISTRINMAAKGTGVYVSKDQASGVVLEQGMAAINKAKYAIRTSVKSGMRYAVSSDDTIIAALFVDKDDPSRANFVPPRGTPGRKLAADGTEYREEDVAVAETFSALLDDMPFG